MKDLIKIIGYIKVYGITIYGKQHFNFDKLESHFLSLGWTKTRIKEAIKTLKDNDIITEVIEEVNDLFYLSISYKTKLNDIDLFENYRLLPQEVQNILSKYDDDDNTYENCEKLVSELETVGYTCDYYLDAIPYDLRKLK